MAINTNYLDTRRLHFSLPHRAGDLAAGSLLLHLDGQTVAAIPRRTRPLSKPDEYIILSNDDGEELGVLRDAKELDEKSQRVLRSTLDHSYNIVQIARVLDVEKETLTGRIRWRVEIATEPAEDGSDSIYDLPVTPPLVRKANKIRSEKQPAFPPSDETPSLEGPENGRDRGKLFRRKGRNDTSAMIESTGEEREFFISGQEDVQTARYPHIYIVDTERNRYEIVDCEALDIESRHLAERYF